MAGKHQSDGGERRGSPWLRIQRLPDGWLAQWRDHSVTCDRDACPTKADFRATLLDEMFGDDEDLSR